MALAKVAVAGSLGMELKIPQTMRPDHYLFSESQGRLVVTLAPVNKEKFEKLMGTDAQLLGKVGGRNFTVTSDKKLVDLPVEKLEEAYKSTFKGY